VNEKIYITAIVLLKGKTMNTLMSKLLSPVGLVTFICFFLPWITVSCGDIPVVNNISAMELAQGITINGQTNEGDPVLYLLLLGAALLFWAGIKLWNARNGLASVGALLGSLLVLGIWFLFRKELQDGIDEAAAQGMILTNEWEIGFWGTLVSGIVGSIAALFSFGERES
jgi:hypothetical protein